MERALWKGMVKLLSFGKARHDAQDGEKEVGDFRVCKRNRNIMFFKNCTNQAKFIFKYKSFLIFLVEYYSRIKLKKNKC